MASRRRCPAPRPTRARRCDRSSAPAPRSPILGRLRPSQPDPSRSSINAQDWLGYTAALLTTASFVPQVWLTWRSRDVSGISLGMYAVFATGVALWLLYGIALGSWPITLANAVTLTLALAILVMKLRYGRPGG